MHLSVSLCVSLQVCLIPESAHGTNAASAQMAGLNVVYIPTDRNGMVSIDMFKEKVCALIAAVCLNICVVLQMFCVSTIPLSTPAYRCCWVWACLCMDFPVYEHF